MRRRNFLMALPPALFAVFAGVAFVALRTENRDELPSALTGRQAPPLTAAKAFAGAAGLDDASLRDGTPTLVNFWASWCGPCRLEHPVLKALSESGVRVVGINYKDAPDKAAAFLAELGDPYAAIAADPTGRVGIDWGIYGVPESFVVGGDGAVLMRYPGPLTTEIVAKRIMPALQSGK